MNHASACERTGFALVTSLLFSTVVLTPGAWAQGGEDAENATVIPFLPFEDFGTTIGFVDDADEVCPYSGSTSPDVFYAYTPPVNQPLTIELCESGYDTKVYVYDGAMGLVACNDDACSSSMGGTFRSRLDGVDMVADETYLIIVDGWSGDAGPYFLKITSPIGLCPTEPPFFGNDFALAFDGVGDYVNVADAPDLRFGDGEAITLEAWISPGNQSSQRNLITKSSDATVNYALRTSDGAIQFFYRNASDTGWFEFSTGAVLNAGQWQHLAVTHVFGTADLAVYVNGESISGSWGAVPSEGPLMTAEPLWLGATSLNPGGGPARVYDGRLDEVRIWEVVRTAVDIQADAQTELTGSEAGLVGYWRFEEGAGFQTNDVAGGHTGLLVGTAWSALDPCTLPCTTDLDQSGDTGFDDLLTVLSLWGPCLLCPADINMDGIVGFSDLLEVLSNWGPCAVLTGGCCLVDGCIDATLEACALAGGLYGGAGTDCSGLSCIGPDGWVVTAPFTWSDDSCLYDNDCALRASVEVRWAVTIPAEADWTFSACGAVFDSWLGLGTTACSADVAISDDDCGAASEITVHLTPGVYYLTLEGFASNDCGLFSLLVTSTP